MKFANIVMTRKGRCTIGDDMQLLAIENLYKYMGIDYKEVVRIPFSELSTYSGEYVILPLSFPFYGYSNGINITNFSPKIIPVFLGFASMIQKYSDCDISYLKKYEPIGCRDQYTMEGLRKNGIEAYLNGCVTLTLPKVRNGYDDKKTIFCVDLTDDIVNLIPKDILKNCTFTSHVYFSDECLNGTENKAREIYNKYLNEAKIIITTRLHAALPCIAAGIPVVLIKERLSIRFPIVQKLIPVYTKKDFHNINWAPQSVDYEYFKRKLLKSASTQLLNAYKKYHDIYEISEFFENDSIEENYIDNFTDTIDFLKANYNDSDEFFYIVWGITPTAELVIDHIQSHYNNAKLVGVIDQFKSLDFHGINSGNKEILLQNPSAICFVCAGAAMPEAKAYFAATHHEKYFFCWQDGLKK